MDKTIWECALYVGWHEVLAEIDRNDVVWQISTEQGTKEKFSRVKMADKVVVNLFA